MKFFFADTTDNSYPEINITPGSLIADDETYEVRDCQLLNTLTGSWTKLNAGKSTRGHTHPGQEEVYIFFGRARMQIDDNYFYVNKNDVVMIPDGAFHRVHSIHKSDGNKTVEFLCVFNGTRNH